MLSNEEMYPYTAKEARDRGELELWRANFRSNCACAGAIELAIRRDFDGMHLKEGCAESVIEQYGYKRVGYVLANTLQMQSYDGRYHETNKRWSRTMILAIFFFVKLGTAYFDYRKTGQFEWTAPAILFACLVFTLTAPLYIWDIVGV